MPTSSRFDDEAARRVLQAQRSAVLARLRELVAEENQLAGEVESDLVDRAADERELSAMERIGDLERQHLAEIEAALARIDDGTYGVCAACDQPIGHGRLSALPATRLCASCARVIDHPEPVTRG